MKSKTFFSKMMSQIKPKLSSYKNSTIKKMFINQESNLIDQYVTLMTSVIWFSNLESINGEITSQIEAMRAIELQKVIISKTQQSLANNANTPINIPEIDSKNLQHILEYETRNKDKLTVDIKDQIQKMIDPTIKYTRMHQLKRRKLKEDYNLSKIR